MPSAQLAGGIPQRQGLRMIEPRPSRRFILLGSAAVAVAAAAGGWTLRNMAVSACRNPQRVKDLEMVKANGCREFWINRYQTTIQTVISGLIGGAGLFFVLRQLREISRQNEMTKRTLEVTNRNSERQYRRAAARALSAIDEYAKISAHLAMHCARLQGQKLPYTGPELSEKDFKEASRGLADIYEVLESDADKAAWMTAQREFDSLTMYISSRREGLEVAQAVQLGGAGYSGPANDAEAMSRAIDLSVALANIRDTLKL